MNAHPIAATQQAADDLALCMAARGGDGAAFDALYRRHAAWARTAAVGMVGRHNADDLVSETFAALLSALRRGMGPVGGVRGYLRTAMRRQAGRLLAVTDDVVPSDRLSLLIADTGEQNELDRDVLASAEEHVMAATDRAAAVRAFASIGDRSRRAIELVDLNELDYTRAAEELGISVGGFGRVLNLARRELFDAWVAEHVPESTASGDHPTRLALARHLIGSAPPRHQVRTAAHLAVCADCRRRTDLVDVVLTRPRRRAAAMGWLALIPLWWARTRRGAHTRRVVAGVEWGWPQLAGVGLALTLVAGLTTLVTPPADEATAPSPAAAATPDSSATADSFSTPTTGLDVAWAPGSTLTGLPAGEEVTLTFFLRATADQEAPATLRIAATPGVEVVQPYSFCGTDPSGMVCPRLGPFSEGDRVTGQLSVRVTDPALARMPALSLEQA